MRKKLNSEVYEALEDTLNWIKTGAVESRFVDAYEMGQRLERLIDRFQPFEKPKAFIDITGMTFHELTVLRYVGNLFFECRCSCGVIKNITGHQLRIGRTKSCGHLRRKAGGKYAREKSNSSTNEKPDSDN